MRLIKLTDSWGSVCLGTAKVVSDKNGVVVSETEFTNGIKKLRFKCMGASKQITCKDGRIMWKKQRLWVTCDIENPFAKVVSNLNYGDKVFLFGTVSSSTYTTESRKQRKSLFCNLEYMQVVEQTDGEAKSVEPDEEFGDFDDI